MGTLRRLAASLPIVKPAYRWLRETIDPHRRALRIARETQGDQLMQWSSTTFADRYPPYFAALQQALAGVRGPESCRSAARRARKSSPCAAISRTLK